MDFDPARDYPLGPRRPDLVTTPGGIPLADLTLAAVREGTLEAEEMRATPETLRRQADVARAAGRPELAANLERAAELEGWAGRLEAAGAPAAAAFVREAAEVYAQRGLLAREPAAV